MKTVIAMSILCIVYASSYGMEQFLKKWGVKKQEKKAKVDKSNRDAIRKSLNLAVQYNRLPDEEALVAIIMQEKDCFDKNEADILKKMAKNLAGKYLILHKNIEQTKSALFTITNLDLITPHEVELYVPTHIKFAPDIVKNILQYYPEAYQEYRFLKDTLIPLKNYEEHHQAYEHKYKEWLARQAIKQG